MEVVRDLERLVAFPTVSNRPLTALAAHVAERFEHLGFRIDRFQDPTQAHKCSLIASIGPRGTDGLVLSGHMDVFKYLADERGAAIPHRDFEYD